MKLTNRQLFFMLALLILVIVLLPIVIGMLVGNVMASGMMGNMMGSGMMGSGMPGNMMGSGQMSGGSWGVMLALSSLRMIAILAALIVGGLLLVRSLTDLSSRRGDGATALELLQRRYAAGQLTQAEYERMRQELLPPATLQPR
ncbi:MAG TPA: SHOCT domain-containing protein [Herpetosiphonaceae bacterium]